MDFFLDSVKQGDIEKALETGLISGLTTNPSLLASEPGFSNETLKELCAIVPGPVSLQISSRTVDEMVTQGKELASLAPNVVVKIPLTPEGLRACTQLCGENIDVNVTLCFSAAQALLAAKAGATYISPFLGRLEETGASPVKLLEDIRGIYDFHGIETQILAASIRHPEHLVMAALAGADVATLPSDVFWQLYVHPLTTRGLEKFRADEAKIQCRKG